MTNLNQMIINIGLGLFVHAVDGLLRILRVWQRVLKELMKQSIRYACLLNKYAMYVLGGPTSRV